MKKLFIIILVSLALCATANAYDIRFAWTAGGTSHDGFRIHYGPSTGEYETIVDVGNVTEYTVLNMPTGIHYVACTAYKGSPESSYFLESGYSNELIVDLTKPNAPIEFRFSGVIIINP